MKKLLFLLIFIPSLSMATRLYDPGSGGGAGLIQNADETTYFTFTGSQVCLYVLNVQQQCWPSVVSNSYLLLETGDFLLLETGDKLILE